MTTDYVPISCALYDTYEIAILHRQRLRLSWDQQGTIHCEAVTPLSLETRRGEEFLHARKADGTMQVFRLDQIRRVEPL
jgi:transcriptional antiterminator Rof (Rho-off)